MGEGGAETQTGRESLSQSRRTAGSAGGTEEEARRLADRADAEVERGRTEEALPLRRAERLG